MIGLVNSQRLQGVANPLHVLEGVVVPPLFIGTGASHPLTADSQNVPLVIDVAQQRTSFGFIALKMKKFVFFTLTLQRYLVKIYQANDTTNERYQANDIMDERYQANDIMGEISKVQFYKLFG
ncbi:hypothetical protein CDAR_109831 [Caerostris darwini]|uniref:Uncharacterized protein n=1 Tax=Caerostris darwini TaxID=1538125 RepID=A0AAV4SXJ8_9ARAC|nr:hypothetical protein CDAR_109831 [Caerostris darwini]